MGRPSKGYLYLQGGSWHLEVSKGSGEERARFFYDLGTADKRVAERRRKDLIAKIASGDSPKDAAQSVPQATTVAEWAESWNEKRHAQGIASARDDAQRLRDYVLPKIGTMFLPDVRPPHLRSVIDAVVLGGKSRQTVKHVRAAIIRIFKAAWRDELIDENPALKVEMPRMKQTKKPAVILADDEFVQLIAYLDRRVDAADAWEDERGQEARRDGSRELRVLCACARILGGMRTSDTNRWDWQQIDLIHFARVTVPRSKTEEPQDIVVPQDLRPILLDWWERAGRPSSGPVFPARRGPNAGGYKAERGISYARRLRRECQRAGLVRAELYKDTARTRRLDFHSFRRAFATAVANSAEVSMQQAMKLAAHSDPRTHLGYITGATEIPDAAVPRMSKRDHARLPETTRQTIEDDSDLARHAGFEPAAFGSGGRSYDHARSQKSAKDNGSEHVDVIARDPRSPAITPECRGLPAASEPSDGHPPRLPDPHEPVRLNLEHAVRLVVTEQPDAAAEAAVADLLEDAADLLWPSAIAGGIGGAS